ncbi:MAG: phospholipase [Propionibacteriaceae bacterium]|nr:phospholipase [Propionibacteriaceae bacterium]
MVMLHGHGSNERAGFDFRHYLPAELVIASIRAPLRVGGGGYAWFPLDPTLALQQIDDASHAVLSWLDEQPAAPSVGMLGFSQGAATGLQAMRLAPTRFSYGVVLSGFVVPGVVAGDAALSTIRPPFFWGRGDGDPVVPSFLVSLTSAWLGSHTTLTERVYAGLGHYVSAAELTDLGHFLRGQLDGEGGLDVG